MSKFIFSNASYVIGYNLSTEVAIELTVEFKSLGIRFASFNAIDELSAAYSKIKYYCGTIANCKDQADLQQLLTVVEAGVGAVHVGSPVPLECESKAVKIQGDQIENLQYKHIAHAMLQYLVPIGMDALAKDSLNFIYPSLFPELELVLDVGENAEFNEYDYQITCDIADDSFAGRAWLRVNLNRLKQSDISLSGAADNLIVDSCRELVNQFLGIVNSNLMTVGYTPSVGLPSVYSRGDMESVLSSGPYIALINLRDEKEIFCMNFGLVLSDKEKALDLSTLQFQSPDDEVDFF